MKTSFPPHTMRLACGLALAGSMLTAGLGAQSPAARIRSEISHSAMTPIRGTLHRLAQPRFDTGRMPAATRLDGVSIVFNRTPAQQAALDRLIGGQQDPASPQYHKWLTPDEFAARFGMSAADLDRVQGWLREQGFAIDSVSRSRNAIRFSGTAGQVEAAFATEMHTYNVNGQRHFAPSTQLSAPAAIAAATTSFTFTIQ